MQKDIWTTSTLQQSCPSHMPTAAILGNQAWKVLVIAESDLVFLKKINSSKWDTISVGTE